MRGKRDRPEARQRRQAVADAWYFAAEAAEKTPPLIREWEQ
jgi:hypothetical protein